MKVSEYLAAYLHQQGVTHVFELVGGMITHLLDAIHRAGDVRLVSVHHEQAASFAADAFGRVTGVPGVAMGTSGPGATNLLTGIGSCYFDSSPAVFITGQVNIHEQKGDRPIRQLGFQETDIVAMAAPITKLAVRVRSAAEFPELLDRAFRTALSGRPGPVLIDIPMDVQRDPVPAGRPRKLTVPAQKFPEPAVFDDLIQRLKHARRPLVLAGGGVRAAGAIGEFRQFVDRVGIPVVHSLMGVDLLPHADPHRVGMIGSYGNRWANQAIARSDLLLVLGSRLDVRQTGAQTDSFREGREIIHVDCEPGEINNRVRDCVAINAELRPFLAEAVTRAPSLGDALAAWTAELAEAKAACPDVDELKDVPGINPNVFMHQLAASSQTALGFAVDVGQHQMWAAQSLDLNADQRFLTSGGMGAMGFALPAAIGMAFAAGGRPVVMIAGDGGFQLNIQELQTVVRNGLPIKLVVINNLCHGMVRQFQQSYFKERYQSTLWGYSAPDFSAVARAYGIPATEVRDPSRVPEALEALWSDEDAPALLHVFVDTFANAYPKMAFGRPISEMEPLAQPLDMEGT